MSRRPIKIEGHDTEEELALELGVEISTLKRWRRLTRKTGRQYGPKWTTADYNGRVIYSHQAKAEYLQSREHRAPRPPRPRASKAA
jgi:transposase-like protein